MLAMFQIPFMQIALAAGGLIGVMCASLGVYVIARRIIFVSIALTQIATLGIAAAFYFQQDPSLWASLFTIVGSLMFAWQDTRRRASKIPTDGGIGVAYAVASAGALLLIALSPKGEGYVLSMLIGDLVATTTQDLEILLSVLGVFGVLYLCFHKEILFTAFDPEMASTLRISPLPWNLLFYLMLGGTIAVVIRIAGPLLTFALLVIPPITAFLLANRILSTWLLSVGLSVLAVFLGIYLSFVYEQVPSSPAIIAVSFGFLAAGWIITNKNARRALWGGLGVGILGLILWQAQSLMASREAFVQQHGEGLRYNLRLHSHLLQQQVLANYLDQANLKTLRFHAITVEKTIRMLQTQNPSRSVAPLLQATLESVGKLGSVGKSGSVGKLGSVGNLESVGKLGSVSEPTSAAVQGIGLTLLQQLQTLETEASKENFDPASTWLGFGHGSEISLPPQEFHQDCVQLFPSQELNYSFETSEPVQFSIHAYESFRPQLIDTQTVEKSYEGELNTKTTRVLCMIWQNGNASHIDVEYEWHLVF